VTLPAMRWRIATLLMLASAISYIDRQALSVNASLIRGEFRLANTDYSYLVTAFLVAYTISQILSGHLVDRLGTRTALTWCAAFWSTAAVLHGVVAGFGGLLACRFLLGIAEAGVVPASMRGIAEWFPVQERSVATGLFAAGTPFGILIAAPLVAFVTLSLGWRMAFVVTGLLGFVWLLPWLRVFFLPEQHPRVDPQERDWILSGRPASNRANAGTRIAELLGHRKVWAIIIGRFMMDPVWWFYVFWLPAYLADVRRLNLATIGQVAWIPFLTATLGTLAGGWASALLLRRTGSLTISRHSVLFFGAAGTLLGIPAASTDNITVSLTLISVVTFAIGAWSTTVVGLAADILPPVAVGSMSGLSGTGAALGGIVFTMLTGRLVDHFSYAPVFWMAGLAPVFGFAALLALMGDVRQIDLGARAEDSVSA
jgi:MFS transporter, ACS family, aldohexuronate transporter